MKREFRRWMIRRGPAGRGLGPPTRDNCKGFPHGVRFGRRLAWSELLSGYARLTAAGWAEGDHFVVVEDGAAMLPGLLIPAGRPPVHRKRRAVG